MKVLSFLNYKGGVGKTTACINIGVGLQRSGKRVLMIDMDPQANMSSGMGAEGESEMSIYHLLKEDSVKVSDVIVNRNGCNVIPSDTDDMRRAELEIGPRTGAEHILKRKLEGMEEHYDYVIIDCPPALGKISAMAATASDEIYIPIRPDYFSLKGIKNMISFVNEEIKNYTNPLLRIGGVIVNFYDRRRISDQEAVKLLESKFPDELFKSFIPQNNSLATAPSQKQSIYDFDSGSTGALFFQEIVDEILRRDAVKNEEVA